jgi:hypothetical protein
MVFWIRLLHQSFKRNATDATKQCEMEKRSNAFLMAAGEVGSSNCRSRPASK